MSSGQGHSDSLAALEQGSRHYGDSALQGWSHTLLWQEDDAHTRPGSRTPPELVVTPVELLQGYPGATGRRELRPGAQMVPPLLWRG